MFADLHEAKQEFFWRFLAATLGSSYVYDSPSHSSINYQGFHTTVLLKWSSGKDTAFTIWKSAYFDFAAIFNQN